MAIKLKASEFIPEYTGKLNFYVVAVNNLLAQSSYNPTISIILCKTKSKTTVEYGLKSYTQPIEVSTYQLESQLPAELIEKLLTVEQLEMELSNAIEEPEAQSYRLTNSDIFECLTDL